MWLADSFFIMYVGSTHSKLFLAVVDTSLQHHILFHIHIISDTIFFVLQLVRPLSIHINDGETIEAICIPFTTAWQFNHR